LNDNNSSKNYDLRTTTKIIFESLYDNEKAKQWFPTAHVIHDDELINIKQLEFDGIEYVVRIKEAIPYSFLKGTVESLDGTSARTFEWTITPNESVKNWTRLTTKTFSDKISPRWISPLPAVGAAVGLITMLESGFASISAAYAATTITSVSSLTPVIFQATTAVEITGKGTVVYSKVFLTAIVMSTIVASGGGILLADAYYSDPLLEYSMYPAQLPSELFGITLMVTNIFSTDDKSEIINYHCNIDSIIYDLEYTFDCFTENSLGNKETIRTTVFIREPNDRLDSEASNCVSQHYTSIDTAAQEYPYLSELPNLSPSRILNLKNTHIKLMDDYYENREYPSAKKHASIVLKYFNINDLQSLSTMGNIIRDENRKNSLDTTCAIAIHRSSLLLDTVWGKLSLAEDYHVTGEYEKSIFWSSTVMDEYKQGNVDVEIDSYVNALIIKANALYRLSLDEQNGFDGAKIHYTLAHEIKKSYDTWFGLGNIDRHEKRFGDAMEKYQQARTFAHDTSEIDIAIQSISQVHNMT
jgi:tetratricopeptide (TPR) repeat protein